MAATITVSGFTVQGNKRKSWGTGQLGAYAAGGVAVTAAQVGLNVLDHLTVQSSLNAAGPVGTPLGWIRSSGKIAALYDNAVAAAAALTEAAAEDLSLQLFSWEAIGF